MNVTVVPKVALTLAERQMSKLHARTGPLRLAGLVQCLLAVIIFRIPILTNLSSLWYYLWQFSRVGDCT